MSDNISFSDSEQENNAVSTAGISQEEYEREMALANVRVRDGDDEITVTETDDEEPEEYEEDGEVEEGEEPETLEINFNEETLGRAAQEINDSEQGFNEMKADIVSRGIDPNEVVQMEANFEANGDLTDQQWNRLAEKGISKNYIMGFVRGQQALATEYVNQIVASVGGINNWNSMVSNLSEKQSVALNKAVANRDLDTVQTIITLAGKNHTQRYGKPAQRSVANRAIQSAPAQAANDGFRSKAEMVEAMRDKRYSRDSAYTKDVERRVNLMPANAW